MKLERAKLDALTCDPANVRKHDQRNLDAIKGSLQRFGQQHPIIVDKDGVIRAGNGRYMAMRALGWSECDIVRTDLKGAEATAFAIADNRTAELATWDDEALAQQLAALQIEDEELALATGYDEKEIAALALDSVEVEEDEIPEPPADPITKPGDLWLLGDHRLLCGDSRSAKDVSRLFNGSKINLAFTSPPYAEQREYDQASGFKPIHPDQYVDWFDAVQANVASHIATDGSWFVNIKAASRGLDTELYVMDLVIAHARKWGWRFACEYCWERGGIPQEPQRRFKNQFEPVFQFARNDWKFRPDAVRSHSDAAFGYGGLKRRKDSSNQGKDMSWSHSAPGLAYPGNRLPTFAGSHEATGHGAAFPVGLPEFFIKAYTDEKDTVYDPFMGSGSTLIAAHTHSRVGYGMEISPAYCDVIVKRWETLTGKKATLA